MGSLPDLSEINLLEAAFLAHENPVFVVGWKTRTILAASDSVQRVFGWRPDEVRGHTTEFLHVDDESFRRFGEIGERALEAGHQVYHCYHMMRRRDGSVFNTENMLGVVRDEDGAPVAAVSVVRDLTESDAIIGSTLERSLDFKALSDRLPGGVFQRVHRADGTVFYNFIRGNIAERFGVSPEEAMQSPEAILGKLHPEDRMRLEHAMEKTRKSLSVLDIELRAYTRGGHIRWLRSISQPTRVDDGSTVWDGLLLDITEQRRAEGELQHLAMHDRLTGLPNVTTFGERLDDAIVQAAESGGYILVGALDINRFYAVNEGYGAHFGDEVLQQVGQRLQSRLYGNDVVARYEGDEFLFFVQGVPCEQECLRHAQELVSLFEAPLPLSSGDRVSVSVSLGFAVSPTDGQDSESLRRKADLALQRVRKNADISFEFYSEKMSEDVIEAIQLERQLHDAIDQRRIVPWYQGQYDLHTGELIGMEVLARWPLPDGEFISPGRFIPLAEETGLIHPLTEVLVERVLADIRAWKEAGLAMPRVAINVSAHQVRFPSFFDWLIETLEAHDLGVDDITVEITESAFLLDFNAVRGILEDLDERGVRLSIDDFGTGYSSLSYLSQLPFRELKIDRAFVAEVDTSDTKRAVVRGIIQLGHALGMRVVAEGIETREQLECLQWLNCDFAQGFYFGRPAPQAAFNDVFGREPA